MCRSIFLCTADVLLTSEIWTPLHCEQRTKSMPPYNSKLYKITSNSRDRNRRWDNSQILTICYQAAPRKSMFSWFYSILGQFWTSLHKKNRWFILLQDPPINWFNLGIEVCGLLVNLWVRDNLSTKDKIPLPMCVLIRGSTVYHSRCYKGELFKILPVTTGGLELPHSYRS